jgi:SAM-dependent methyltransferase
MQERHTDRRRYFNEQAITVEKYVIPFLQDVIEITAETTVLEIGCGEGGNLQPFLDRGCKRVVGIDLGEQRIENAKIYLGEHKNAANAELLCSDIYDIEDLGQFDVIITRDVLEHIHNQDRFMEFVKKFLAPGGKLFHGFPPWQNPFGGHQQMCTSKFLSKLPYFHLLPNFMYRGMLKMSKETPARIESLMEIKETGISIERLERILKKTNFKKDKRLFYFIQPNYEIKFGLKPRKQWAFFSWIPWVRNFTMTAAYYIVSVNEEAADKK